MGYSGDLTYPDVKCPIVVQTECQIFQYSSTQAPVATRGFDMARVSHQCSVAIHNRTLSLITYEEYLNA